MTQTCEINYERKTFSNKHKVTGVAAIAVLVALGSCEYRTANSSVLLITHMKANK